MPRFAHARTPTAHSCDIGSGFTDLRRGVFAPYTPLPTAVDCRFARAARRLLCLQCNIHSYYLVPTYLSGKTSRLPFTRAFTVYFARLRYRLRPARTYPHAPAYAAPHCHYLIPPTCRIPTSGFSVPACHSSIETWHLPGAPAALRHSY